MEVEARLGSVVFRRAEFWSAFGVYRIGQRQRGSPRRHV